MGYHPHSGQDDYQGPSRSSQYDDEVVVVTATTKKKYGGDYEAQRHWMELTYHLPISEWYYHDLEYWGLDYPPLTAYVSWVFGWVAHNAGMLTTFGDVLDNDDDYSDDDIVVATSGEDQCVEGDDLTCYDAERTRRRRNRRDKRGLEALRDLVALHSSRWGYEETVGKMYMRFTVLISDVLVYFTAVWVLVSRLTKKEGVGIRSWLLLVALCQPALILIDHGHFQYNTVSLGLALWSFYYMTITESFVGPILGSVLFSLALNFKQMELYHSPAVFAYLLGRCFRHNNNASQCGLKTLGRFIALGLTVILTFAILWLPFTTLIFQPDGTSGLNLDVWVQILKRLFPFQRGIFEGKVANIWCALSVKPFSIRDRILESTLPLAAAGLTLALILPPCWKLFSVGKGDYSDRKGGCNDIRILLWGSASTSLAFFLASFQVHEKGILIALAPISLLAVDEPRFSMLFSIVATWSLWPLLVIDRLTDAYVCCVAIFVCIYGLTGVSSSEVSFSAASNMSFTISLIIMIFMHLLELLYSPPQHLPDLFPVLWSLGGCGLFSIAYLGTLFALVQKTSPNEKNKMGQLKRNVTTNGTISIISIMGVILLSYPRESEGFILFSPITGCDIMLRESSFFGSDDSITQDLLDRARLPLGWESRNAQDSKPILNLSAQRFANYIAGEGMYHSDGYAF